MSRRPARKSRLRRRPRGRLRARCTRGRLAAARCASRHAATWRPDSTTAAYRQASRRLALLRTTQTAKRVHATPESTRAPRWRRASVPRHSDMGRAVRTRSCFRDSRKSRACTTELAAHDAKQQPAKSRARARGAAILPCAACNPTTRAARLARRRGLSVLIPPIPITKSRWSAIARGVRARWPAARRLGEVAGWAESRHLGKQDQTVHCHDRPDGGDTMTRRVNRAAGDGDYACEALRKSDSRRAQLGDAPRATGGCAGARVRYKEKDRPFAMRGRPEGWDPWTWGVGVSEFRL